MKLEEAPNDVLVKAYVELRDQIRGLEDQVKDLKAKQDKIEGVFLVRFNDEGLESVRTKYGTAYKTTKLSTSVADWEAFLGFVQQNGAWDMLMRGANKTSVKGYREANDDLPPGINWVEEKVIGIRRS